MHHSLFSNETRQLRAYIKMQLKSKKLGYKDLSAMTQLSPLKIRRIMSNQDFKLEDLILISRALQFQLFASEICELAVQPRPSRLNSQQVQN
jgi:hypothetical protein